MWPWDFGEYVPNLSGIVSIAILSVFGVLGNIILISVIVLNRSLRTLPNVLIVNLAIGDLLYIICVGPAWIEHELNPIFALSEPACKFKHYITLVSQGSCVFSLTMLSFERYSVIVRGMQTRQSRKKLRTVLAVAVVWIFSLVLVLPTAFLAYKKTSDYASECHSSDSDEGDSFLGIYTTVIFYIIPVLLISVFYTKVALALLRSAATLQGQDSQTTNSAQQEANRRRLAIICLAISAFFAVFWLPHYAFTLWSRFDQSKSYSEDMFEFGLKEETFRVVQYFMALINSCTSPWLLFVLSTTHRRYLLTPCKSCNKGLNRKSTGSLASNGVSMSNASTRYRAGTKPSITVQSTQI